MSAGLSRCGIEVINGFITAVLIIGVRFVLFAYFIYFIFAFISDNIVVIIASFVRQAIA